MSVDPDDVRHDDDPDEVVVPRRVSRRRLLTTVGVLGAAGLMTAGGITMAGGTAGGQSAARLSANLAQLPGVDHLRAIGETVESAGVLDHRFDEFAALVAPDGVASPLRWCSTTAPVALRDHVLEASRDDFVRGEVVAVDGWRLARTEAALAVLVVRADRT